MNKEQKKLYKSLLFKYKFDKKQKEQIEYGIKSNLEVSWYANPKFTFEQMGEIRRGLELGLKVS